MMARMGQLSSRFKVGGEFGSKFLSGREFQVSILMLVFVEAVTRYWTSRCRPALSGNQRSLKSKGVYAFSLWRHRGSICAQLKTRKPTEAVVLCGYPSYRAGLCKCLCSNARTGRTESDLIGPGRRVLWSFHSILKGCWSSQARATSWLYRGFRWEGFSVHYSGQACELGYGALRCVWFSVSLAVALSIHRPASPPPLFATLTQPKILEQKKLLPWSFAETALVGEWKLVVNLAGWKCRGRGCHQWPAGGERWGRSLRDASGLIE